MRKGLVSVIILSTEKLNLLKKYWQRVISGISYTFKKIFNFLTLLILAWTDPVPAILDKTSTSILDVGCGEGLPMKLINLRVKIKKRVGIDLFEPYIEKAKRSQTHSDYVITDIKKIKFKNGSFDTVLASHVLEHLSKKDALRLLDSLEKIAKKQIIIAAPIGEMFHPEIDGNKLQLHLSEFEPVEFEKKGYKVIRYGWRWLLGYNGLIDRYPNIFIRELSFIVHLLATPIFYIFPNIGTYTFVATKKISKKTY